MKLNRITLHNYRNIEDMNFFPCAGINVIYGDNAQGKTNLMEAIWLFTGNSSFRGAKAGQLINFDKENMKIDISFSDKEREQNASLFFGIKKKIFLNRVELNTIGDLSGNFYAVGFSPFDLTFVQDGPKFRRRFLDIAISQICPRYKNYLSTYEKLIFQRNALLKNAAFYKNIEENIDVWDLQLAKAGTILSIYRGDYVKKLNAIAKNIYQGLSDQKETLDIYYSSTVYKDIDSVTSYEEDKIKIYYKKLKESYHEDIKQGFTGIGIHRDDLDIKINGVSVRIYGSQGQQRSSVITLKLAEAKLLKKATGEDPIMILDDVMSELDVSRQNYILNHLQDMQVFITCCDACNITNLENGKIMKIKNGTLVKENIIG